LKNCVTLNPIAMHGQNAFDIGIEGLCPLNTEKEEYDRQEDG